MDHSACIHSLNSICVLTGKVDMVDMSLPMYYDRMETPLPDRRYKEVLTEADKSLKQKEKGPWSQLSKEEKIACRLKGA